MPRLILYKFKVDNAMPSKSELFCLKVVTMQEKVMTKKERQKKNNNTSDTTRPQHRTKADTLVENTERSVNNAKKNNMAMVDIKVYVKRRFWPAGQSSPKRLPSSVLPMQWSVGSRQSIKVRKNIKPRLTESCQFDKYAGILVYWRSMNSLFRQSRSTFLVW
mmetsp:Transcript_105160/g.206269  ORF Transcript_105160/g.206269 Transcript_105160/m.206269 type:complete len:162 (+) Transcript_105160:979-1464(+)